MVLALLRQAGTAYRSNTVRMNAAEVLEQRKPILNLRQFHIEDCRKLFAFCYQQKQWRLPMLFPMRQEFAFS